MIKTIYMVRHGQTDQNKKRLVQGRRDFPLNDTGRSQAHQVASYIKAENYKFDSIYSSPLSRAYETACIIKEDLKLDLPINKKFAFIEREFGEVEGKDVSPETFKSVLDDSCPGMEKSYEIQKRVIDGILDCLNNTSDNNILIVCHSHTIKAVLTKLDKSISFYSSMVNCAINIFTYDSETKELKIQEYNIDPYKKEAI